MSEVTKASWGTVLKGAAVVTAIVAVGLFVPGVSTAIGGATGAIGGALSSIGEAIGGSISGTGSLITNIGGWIAKQTTQLATYGQAGSSIGYGAVKITSQAATALGTAAVVGAAGMTAATSFVDRLNRSAETVGVETGRGRS